MTPRERVLAAIAHREADRVPVDLGSTGSTGISGIAYARLRDLLGILCLANTP
jgi:uroporphyrinogen decarboxylase